MISNLTRKRLKIWIPVFVLVLLLHGLVLMQDVKWGGVSAPVEVRQVDPAKLAAIRQQWKKQALLLSKDQPRDKVPSPKDARYFSDRNIQVDHEQRATRSEVIPERTQNSSSAQDLAHGSLRSLGVNLPFHPPQSDQSILDPELKEGQQNLLNAQESTYYTFYARLYEAIGPLWQSYVKQAASLQKLRPGDYITTVDVVLNAEGTLMQVNILKSCGVPALDAVIPQAWQRIAHFPNPPRELLDSQGLVHTGWTFTLQVNHGFQLNYSQPERTY